MDDEVEFTAGLSKVLRRRGFEVETASDGLTAVSRIVHEAFNVIILDVKMPGMDGIQVLAEIKRLGIDSRVILLTGHLSISEEEAGLKDGAFAYLFKPFPISKLMNLVEEAAGGGRKPVGSG